MHLSRNKRLEQINFFVGKKMCWWFYNLLWHFLKSPDTFQSSIIFTCLDLVVVSLSCFVCNLLVQMCQFFLVRDRQLKKLQKEVSTAVFISKNKEIRGKKVHKNQILHQPLKKMHNSRIFKKYPKTACKGVNSNNKCHNYMLQFSPYLCRLIFLNYYED